jgi:hypothetical protein
MYGVDLTDIAGQACKSLCVSVLCVGLCEDSTETVCVLVVAVVWTP